MARSPPHHPPLSLSLLIPKPRTSTLIRPLYPPVTSTTTTTINAPNTIIRSFTTSPPTRAVGEMTMPKNLMKSMPSQPSMRGKIKNLAASGEKIPDDLGLLPLTFIRPANRDLPRLLGKEWWTRLRIEWMWVRTRVQNFFTLYYFLSYSRPRAPASRKKDKLPLFLRTRIQTARDLHKSFYTALASGDIARLSTIACKGLLENSLLRIAQRPAEQRAQQFEIVKYNGLTLPRWTPWPLSAWVGGQAVQVVSDRVAPLPFGSGGIIRQCVVRIRSRQTLSRGAAAVTGDAKPVERDMEEWVVLQRMRVDGVERGGWKVWGTVKPSERKEWEKMLEEGQSKTRSWGDRFGAEVRRRVGGLMGKA